MKTSATNFDKGIGRKDIARVLTKLQTLHAERRKRLQQSLTIRQSNTFQLLPLLLHANHPLLPGFVNTQVPCGIAHYMPDKQTVAQAKKLAKSFNLKGKRKKHQSIQGLYLMGSMGSIGQSAHSDLDVWLCHNGELEQKDMQLLRKKCSLLEKWAARQGTELHIFLIDVPQFRNGHRDPLSSESSGSLQAGLLLEEFYRTAIHMAGKYPLWWLVPADHEHDYSKYSQWLIEHRFIKTDEYLDFGGLDKIIRSEFVSATVWQLYKAIQNPYKALLKLLLNEVYASQYPRPQWLALEIKKAIYSNHIDINQLDPYILMYQALEKYFSSKNDTTRTELARRCLYFKSDVQIAQSNHHESWKCELWKQLIDQWDWSKEWMLTLNDRKHWKIDRVLPERELLVGELTRSYRLLQKFIGADASWTVDATLLGRKLYTAFEYRQGKIEQLGSGISNDLSETEFTLQQGSLSHWQLHRGQRTNISASDIPLVSYENLLEMLCWLSVNKILIDSSKIHFYPSINKEIRQEINGISITLNQFFTHHSLACPIEKLRHKAAISSSLGIINHQLDLFQLLTDKGQQITSDRIDPFSFGGNHINLCQTIDLITLNSWGEILLSHYSGTEGLLQMLCHYLDERSDQTEAVQTVCFSSIRGDMIAKRLQQLVEQLSLYQDKHWRYVIGIADTICVIEKRDTHHYHILDNNDDLIDYLQHEHLAFSALYCDSANAEFELTSTLFEYNKEGVLQLFYQIAGAVIIAWYIDEKGILTRQLVAEPNEKHFVMHNRRLLDSLVLQQRLALTEEQLNSYPEIYQLKQADDKSWYCLPYPFDNSQLMADFSSLELISNDYNNTEITLMHNGKSYNKQQGQDIYQSVAKAILAERKDKSAYPIYLTAIKLASSIADLPSTKLILSRKVQIEKKLTAALRQLEV